MTASFENRDYTYKEFYEKLDEIHRGKAYPRVYIPQTPKEKLESTRIALTIAVLPFYSWL